MNDDLLRALGREQRAELEREPEPGELDELARPFDESERASILDSVFARVEAPAAASDGAAEPDPVEPGPAEPESAEPESAKVIELASRRRLVLSGAVLAAAAALALAWWASPSSLPHDAGPLALVPPYTITQLSGGIADQRSDPADPVADPAADPAAVPELTLHADSVINWVFTPTEPSHGAVALALLARADASGNARFLAPLDAEISDVGAVRLRGPLNRHVELEPGPWSLTLFIAEPDALPDYASAALGLALGHPGPWRSVTIRVIVVDE